MPPATADGVPTLRAMTVRAASFAFRDNEKKQPTFRRYITHSQIRPIDHGLLPADDHVPMATLRGWTLPA